MLDCYGRYVLATNLGIAGLKRLLKLYISKEQMDSMSSSELSLFLTEELNISSEDTRELEGKHKQIVLNKAHHTLPSLALLDPVDPGIHSRV